VVYDVASCFAAFSFIELSELGFMAKLHSLWLAIPCFSLRASERMSLCASVGWATGAAEEHA